MSQLLTCVVFESDFFFFWLVCSAFWWWIGIEFSLLFFLHASFSVIGLNSKNHTENLISLRSFLSRLVWVGIWPGPLCECFSVYLPCTKDSDFCDGPLVAWAWVLGSSMVLPHTSLQVSCTRCLVTNSAPDPCLLRRLTCSLGLGWGRCLCLWVSYFCTFSHFLLLLANRVSPGIWCWYEVGVPCSALSAVTILQGGS